MTNSYDLANDLIFRARHIKEFTVITPVPDDFNFNGPVPFTVRISGGYIEADILAMDFDEATKTMHEWLDGLKDTDD
jgi:hypothetical protein